MDMTVGQVLAIHFHFAYSFGVLTVIGFFFLHSSSTQLHIHRLMFFIIIIHGYNNLAAITMKKRTEFILFATQRIVYRINYILLLFCCCCFCCCVDLYFYVHFMISRLSVTMILFVDCNWVDVGACEYSIYEFYAIKMVRF